MKPHVILAKYLILTLSLLALSPSAYALAPECAFNLVSGTSQACVQHQGINRTFIIHIPDQYKASHPLPLVINFHGRKGTSEQQAEMTRFHELADREGFIVVEPQGVDRSWNTGTCCADAYERGIDDIGFTRQLLDTLIQRLAIDTRRIYATGFSNGARMAHQAGCELSDYFAAIAPIAGPLTSAKCQPSQPVAVFSFHGRGDACTPYSGGDGRGEPAANNRPVEEGIAYWAQRNGCSSSPRTITGSPEKHIYSNCKSGADVVLYSSTRAGHIWPGAEPYLFWRACGGRWVNDFDATHTIWQFFKSHPKQ